uniref:Uncharacterized protein n=1 Tax=Mucochytrium quahogii TaxID=96639 RepID=A0A7S2RSN7_9STRA|mmetsp:Transcript_19494/g.42209  ORF Transcript_19494/g.42209 Transcript_19494/m.42209 type:complete len:437 (+) Transcript_19494:1851-3161(+)
MGPKRKSTSCQQAIKLVTEGGPAQIVIPLSANTWNKVDVKLPSKDHASLWNVGIARCQSIGGRRRLYNNNNRFNRHVAERYHRYRYHTHRLGGHVNSLQAVGKVEMDLQFTSDERPTGWTSEFGADEVLLLPGTFFFVLVFMVAGGAVMWQLFKTRHSRKSSLWGLYAVSGVCLLYFTSLFVSLIELLLFAREGKEYIDKISLLRLLSVLLDELTHIGIVLLLVILSSGWMIISPTIQHLECVAAFGWYMAIFYFLATIGMFIVSSSPNFTDEFHGPIWVIVLATEVCVLLYALFNAVTIIFTSEKLKAPNGNKGLSFQATFRYKTMVAIAILICYTIIANITVTALSADAPDTSRSDVVFAVSTTCNSIALLLLLGLFLPSNIERLHDSNALTNRTGAAPKVPTKEEVSRNKADEYDYSFSDFDYDEDDDLLPLI